MSIRFLQKAYINLKKLIWIPISSKMVICMSCLFPLIGRIKIITLSSNSTSPKWREKAVISSVSRHPYNLIPILDLIFLCMMFPGISPCSRLQWEVDQVALAVCTFFPEIKTMKAFCKTHSRKRIHSCPLKYSWQLAFWFKKTLVYLDKI